MLSHECLEFLHSWIAVPRWISGILAIGRRDNALGILQACWLQDRVNRNGRVREIHGWLPAQLCDRLYGLRRKLGDRGDNQCIGTGRFEIDDS